MIVIDFSQIYLAPIFLDGACKQCAQNPSSESRDMMLHYAVNSVRANFVAHGKKYGKMVIACDSNSWRRGVFPEYKYKRRENRKTDKSGIDWQFVGETSAYVKQALRDYFPFAVVEVPGLEADDIIGVLAKLSNEQTADQETNIFGEVEAEPFLIISSDADHYQLHKYDNVRQWSPQTKKLVKPSIKPSDALINKIVLGDPGDGIPSVIHTNDHFVNPPTIKSIFTAKKKAAIFAAIENNTIQKLPEFNNYLRNSQLVSYEFTPPELAAAALKVYEQEKSKPHSKMKLMTFLAENKLNILYSKIGDFYQ